MTEKPLIAKLALAYDLTSFDRGDDSKTPSTRFDGSNPTSPLQVIDVE